MLKFMLLSVYYMMGHSVKDAVKHKSSYIPTFSYLVFSLKTLFTTSFSQDLTRDNGT